MRRALLLSGGFTDRAIQVENEFFEWGSMVQSSSVSNRLISLVEAACFSGWFDLRSFSSALPLVMYRRVFPEARNSSTGTGWVVLA